MQADSLSVSSMAIVAPQQATSSMTLTSVYANGVALKDIQEWLGHSDISTTGNIYTHLDYSSKIDSANAIMGFFQEEKETEQSKEA